ALQADGHGRVAGPARGVRDLVGVRPDLAVESGAAGIEDPHHLPLPARDGDALPDLRPQISPAGRSPDHDLARGPLGRPPLDELDAPGAKQIPASLRHAANPYVGGAALVDALELEDDEQLRRRDLLAAFDSDGWVGGERLRRLAGQEAGQLGSGPLAQQDGVLAYAGGLEGFLYPVGEHQHRGEHEYDQSQPDGGGEGGEAPPQDGADVVRERDHSCLRSASTMASLAACTAGNELAATPMAAAASTVAMPVESLKPTLLRKPNCAIARPKPPRIGRARITPISPPTAPSSAPSPIARLRTCLGRKPMARITPTSGVRS